MEQSLYPVSDKAFVLTCSYDAKSPDADRNIEACRKAVQSIIPSTDKK